MLANILSKLLKWEAGNIKAVENVIYGVAFNIKLI